MICDMRLTSSQLLLLRRTKYKNELRQLDWDKFDDMQDGFSKLTDEADFLIDLMSEKDLFDDNGAITNEGIATKALHAQNYDVYMAQADQYAKAIAEINKSIANDPYNTKLLERREDLIESHRDAILAANDEKDALKDLAEDGFDALLDSLDRKDICLRICRTNRSRIYQN